MWISSEVCLLSAPNTDPGCGGISHWFDSRIERVGGVKCRAETHQPRPAVPSFVCKNSPKKLASVYVVAYTISMKRYEVEVYETEEGKAPFQEWVDGIREKTARTLVNSQVRKAQLGNFGDWKSLTGAGGICEMRISYGPGFRIYYFVVGQKVILLLSGSTKNNQDRTIAKAKEYLADYNRRVKQ